MSLQYADLDPADAVLLRKAWESGNLAWKLRPYQLEAYETMWRLIDGLKSRPPAKDDYRVASFVASRKIGKSYMESLLAFEYGFRFPKSLIRIVAPTAVEARDIFLVEFEKILDDCPPDLRPAPKGVDGNWRFPNGSIIYLKGADSEPNRLRGPTSHLNIVDEAAYVRKLNYLVESILYPMTINTRGVTLLASTLNKSPNADFNARHKRCKALGQSATVNVYQAGFTPEQIEAERSAVTPITWAIEYECQEERDEDQTLIPEWTVAVASVLTEEAPLGDELLRPEMAHWQRFTSADWGTVDNTAIVTGYYDFKAATAWITGERIVRGAEVTSTNIAKVIKEMEAEEDALRPHVSQRLRVGDHDIAMLQGLQIDHGLVIRPVRKPTIEGGVNNFRTYVSTHRLRVSPKCVNLLACIEHGAWKERASARRDGTREREIDRSDLVDSNKVGLSHFDCLVAAIYFLITVDQNRTVNPLPMQFASAQLLANHGPLGGNKYHSRANSMPTGKLNGNTPGWLPRRK